MTGDQIATILYLALLGSVIGGYFFVSGREQIGRTLQQAAIWGLIFLGAVAVAGLWPSLRGGVAPRQMVAEDGRTVAIPRGLDGHFRVVLDVEGVGIPFIVDTGASDMVLSRQDAAKVGIDPDRLAYAGRAMTANGPVPLASVVLDEVSLGGITDRNVRASVNGGEMRGSLLGMTYLDRFARIEIEGDRLILTR